MKLTIKVFSNETACVPNINTLSVTTPRRFVGRVWSAEQHGFILKDQPEELVLTNRKVADFYKRAVRDGSLICADEKSAKICGVSFYKDNSNTRK